MNKEKETKTKKDRFKNILIVILLLIIICLLIFGCTAQHLGKVNEDTPTSSGVDVFNINCECINDPDKDCHIPSFEEDLMGQIMVNDDNGNWLYQQRLNIFANAEFDGENKIAPGSKGVYYFVVNNNTEVDLDYAISMIESSEYDIDMEYRLKVGNAYAIGGPNDWVSAEYLNLDSVKVGVDDSNTYALEWRWNSTSDEKDTEIGENMRSLYTLKIKIEFNSLVEED